MADETGSNPIAQAIAAIATVVLTILGLAHVAPNFLVAIATIAFGAALLLHGGTMLSDYARLARQTSTATSTVVGSGAFQLCSSLELRVSFLAFSRCSASAPWN
jgi:hypothetical protein